MKIEENMIATKKIVGETRDGSPVVMIVTYGGLYAFFSKNSKTEIETLGMAPHKAIAAWMAEKKSGIKWNDDFAKYEEVELERLHKSKIDSFVKLKALLFDKTLIKSSKEKLDYYIVYDTKKIQIGLMKKSDVQRMLDKNELYRESFIRNFSCSEPACLISQHRDFTVGKNGG